MLLLLVMHPLRFNKKRLVYGIYLRYRLGANKLLFPGGKPSHSYSFYLFTSEIFKESPNFFRESLARPLRKFEICISE